MFEDYFYIYKNMFGKWNRATNPKFIAEHKECRAIEKDSVKDINEYIRKLNKELANG